MNIPLLSDITKKISKDYGVLLEDAGVALRLFSSMFSLEGLDQKKFESTVNSL